MYRKTQIIDLVYSHFEKGAVIFTVHKVQGEYIFTIFKDKRPDTAFSVSDLSKTEKFTGYKAEIIEMFKRQMVTE